MVVQVLLHFKTLLFIWKLVKRGVQKMTRLDVDCEPHKRTLGLLDFMTLGLLDFQPLGHLDFQTLGLLDFHTLWLLFRLRLLNHILFLGLLDFQILGLLDSLVPLSWIKGVRSGRSDRVVGRHSDFYNFQINIDNLFIIIFTHKHNFPGSALVWMVRTTPNAGNDHD